MDAALETLPARFTVVGRARRGGGSDVYRALDKSSGETVALKVVRAAGPVAAARLEREAALCRSLSHPGLPSYVWHGVDALERPCLAIAWIEGPSLAERLVESALSWRDTLRVARALAAPLAHLHARGIVHRDVKPSNVLLGGGSVDRARLIDLGIARDEDRTADWTRAGEPIGTPGYMAPEQARGRLDVDARADVFGLGALIFRCIAGRAPFVGDSVTATLAKLLFDRAPRLAEVTPQVPLWLDELVASMLQTEREERPANAAAVLAALERESQAESGAPVSAPGSRPAALTEGEQRVVGVVVAQLAAIEPEPEDVTRSLATAAARDPWLVERALAVATGHGARAEIVANGTLVAVLDRDGDADERAEAAARLALSLRSVLGGLPCALATGMGMIGDGPLFGEAIERASALCAARQRWSWDENALSAPSADALLVDETTAALLADRMRVEPASEGHWLLPSLPRTKQRPPLIGRRRELRLLSDELDEAQSRPAARAVVVLGPAGIGKSRIAAELLARIDDEALILRAAARASAGSLALVTDLVREAVRKRDAAASDDERIRAFIGELLGTHDDAPVSVQVRAARQDPMLMADQMRRTFIDVLRAELERGPLVLVLDDLHRVDGASAKFIDAALRVLADEPLFVLGLARPEARERAREVFDWRGLVTLELPELGGADTRELARTLLGSGASDHLVTQIASGSTGNPFFLEELARSALSNPNRAALSAPQTVLNVLRALLEQLPSATRRTLRAASVYGMRFSLAAVAALLGSERSHPEIARQLDLLCDEQLLEPAERPFEDGLPAFVFRHDLVREAAEGTLTDPDRELGHRLAGLYLADLPHTDASVVAEHFVRGRDPRRAAEFTVRAAEHALDVGDLDAAVACGERAERLGADGERLGRAHLAQAEARRWKGDARGAHEHGAAALSLLAEGSAAWCRAAGEVATACGKLGQHDELAALAARLVAGLPGEALGPRVVAASRAATQLFYAGRIEAARQMLPALDALRSESLAGEPLARARLLGTLSVDALFDRRPDRQLAFVREARDAFLTAGDLRDACLYELTIGHAAMQLGRHSEAVEVLAQATRAAEQLGAPYLATLAKLNQGLALAQRGEPGDALDGAALLADVVAETSRTGDARQQCAARSYRALALLRAGEIDAAEREARQAAELSRSAPTLAAGAAATLAETLLAQGRFAEALSVTAAAEVTLDGAEEGAARLRWAHAEALEQNGEREAAQREIEHARRLIDEQSARIEDVELRQSFERRVLEHRRTYELAARLGEI